MSYPPTDMSDKRDIGYIPPPQVGYPPQEQQPGGAYPSYPMTANPAPPQQPGYPPQQLGYPPQQPGYPPQPQTTPFSNFQDAPPSYSDFAPPTGPTTGQQTSTNVVVVQQQPMPIVYTTGVRPVNDNFLTLSIVLTVLCIFCFSWYGLLCTIPALIFAITAREADQKGDTVTARTHARISLTLNIVAIVTWIVIFIIIIASISASAASGSSSSSYSYRSYYGYCYYYSYYYYCYK